MCEGLVFPELPADFIKWIKETGREIREIPKDVVEAYCEYKRYLDKKSLTSSPSP